MATFQFDPEKFRLQFPAFSNIVTFTNEQLSAWWDMANQFVSDPTGGCYALNMNVAKYSLCLNLMTAHIALLNTKIAKGQPAGVVTGATIDKVSVQLMPPIADNNWQYWLSQTPYGQQLLALLQGAAAGGAYYGGYPVTTSMRR